MRGTYSETDVSCLFLGTGVAVRLLTAVAAAVTSDACGKIVLQPFLSYSVVRRPPLPTSVYLPRYLVINTRAALFTRYCLISVIIRSGRGPFFLSYFFLSPLHPILPVFFSSIYIILLLLKKLLKYYTQQSLRSQIEQQIDDRIEECMTLPIHHRERAIFFNSATAFYRRAIYTLFARNIT